MEETSQGNFCTGLPNLLYLANREKVEGYLEKIGQDHEEAWREQQRQRSEFLQALRERLDRQRRAFRREKAEVTTPVSR